MAIVLRRLHSRYQLVQYCSQEHRVGQVILQHHAKVPCEVALWVAEHAWSLWEELRVEFPGEASKPFELRVIWDRYRGPGFKFKFHSRVEINMARFFLDITHPSFPDQERRLRGTIAEELHHVVRDRRFGDEDYVFRGDGESDHPWLEKLLHYAVNDFEYEAIRFCVRTTGDRADLFEKVVEYRRSTGREV